MDSAYPIWFVMIFVTSEAVDLFFLIRLMYRIKTNTCDEGRF